eukprot:CAMPEP_0113498184 /NCGR_PEP_ID=MMETSP0014_2-20120614/31021_1 /TAXON_ID=2857 /ORGANISM="Nitzschia sp." /LENGTH=474 /DNA_ID=CAMNT_0000392159 /DNA_START=186 /DNA_END=1607 /DNA_ORIENTATION=+ /assembly_acc=CAM_ASM_000159
MIIAISSCRFGQRCRSSSHAPMAAGMVVTVDALRPGFVRPVRTSSSPRISQRYIYQYNYHDYQIHQRRKQKHQWQLMSSSSGINPYSDELPESLSSLSSQTKRLPRIYVGPKRPMATPVSAAVSSSVFEPTTTSSSRHVVRLSVNSIVPLTVDQSHYLHVMRIQSVKRWGDQAGYVRIFNGVDGEWLARVALDYGSSSGGSIISDETFEASHTDDNDNSDKKKKKKRKKKPERRKRRNSNVDEDDGTVLECVQQLVTQDHHQRPNDHEDNSDAGRVNDADDDRIGKNVSVQLYVGRLKKQQLRWVVEKATELGVDGITILDTDFTGTTTKGGGEWEYDKHIIHIIEAAEQCERLSIPNLSTGSVSLVDLVPYIHDDTDSLSEDHQQVKNDQQQQQHHQMQHLWLVCRERSPDSTPIFSALQHTNNCTIHVLVGPEGGWSPNEIEVFSHLTRLLSNIQFVSLGSLVLRAETAAIT